MARSIICLDDRKQWKFRQVKTPASPWLQVSRMPTNVHLDLLHHGLIAHPFVGKNENHCQWVGESAWVYRAKFSSPDLCFGDKAALIFDGLDTYSTVVLNGKVILKTKDMFVPERVNVTQDLLLDKENLLEITFESTWLTGKTIVEQQTHHKWGCWNGDASRLAVRKAQYHYGWDWGPTLLTCGPWRPISVEVYTSRIADLYFTTHVDKSLTYAEIVAKADIEGDGEEVTFEITVDGKVVGVETVAVKDNFATATFRNHNPQLWYPHTYGKQPLYNLEARLVTGDNVLDTGKRRFGLRRAEIVQRKLEDKPGTTFMFVINSISIFCGGSNWIPGEILGTMSDQKYKDWIKAIVDGNQVMLRAWGGGMFEEQNFYDTCDELGVLIWQDLLFACGNYPADEHFLALIKREATDNVKRLRHHPCIVIFAGNNEDYAYRESENLEYDPNDPNPTSWLNTDFPARYIYELILPEIVKDLAPNIYYHFGSPFSGKDSSNPHAGDIHQWNVWHGTQERYQEYDKLAGRFVSEFGMEAFPDIATVESYLPNGCSDVDRYPQSSTVDFHNKAAGQERRLALYLAENIPTVMEPFEQYIYCTQLMQAECISNAYKLWKRQWKGPGREYCAGALVWQANDCWPCTSWSVMDYYLRPKLAYYAIKRELKHLTIGMKRTVEIVPVDKYTRAYTKTYHKIELWACNLSLESRSVKVYIKTHNLITGKSDTPRQLIWEIMLLPNRSKEIAVFEIPVAGYDSSLTIAADKKLDASIEEQQQQTVVAAYLCDSDGAIRARAINWLEPLKHVHLPKPSKIRLKVVPSLKESLGDVTCLSNQPIDPRLDSAFVSVWADVPIKGLTLEVIDPLVRDAGVKFEDNGVDLVPGEETSIGVQGLKPGDERRLRVRYLGM